MRVQEPYSSSGVVKTNITSCKPEVDIMPILLWLIGIPIPIILLIWLLT